MIHNAAGRRNAGPSVTVADFERWFVDYAPSILQYVTRRLGRGVAEDVVAEVFTQAWRCRDEFDCAQGSPRAWLFGITTNLVSRHGRSEQRQLRAYQRHGVEYGRPSGRLLETEVIARDEYERVLGIIAGLQAPERDLLLLHAWAELPYGDLAEIFGIEVGTVKSRMSRLRARLAKSAGMNGGEP